MRSVVNYHEAEIFAIHLDTPVYSYIHRGTCRTLKNACLVFRMLHFSSDQYLHELYIAMKFYCNWIQYTVKPVLRGHL